MPSTDLRELAKRDDTIVLLPATGPHKGKLIRGVIEAGLCNAVITEVATSLAILGLQPQRDVDDLPASASTEVE